MSVSAPATSPPVQDFAVAIVSLRIRHKSSSERERARASLPLMLLAPGETDGSVRGRGDAFLAAGETEAFAGRCLDGDAEMLSPVISAMRARMVSRSGPIFGRSQIIVTSRLAIRPPRAVTRSTAYLRNLSDAAPFHCGSLVESANRYRRPPARRGCVDQGMQADVAIGMGKKPRVCGTRTRRHR